MTVELRTPRLILTPLASPHTDDLFRVFQDDATMRYWHHPKHRAPEETAAMIWSLTASPMARWWAVVLRQTNRAVGCVGYLDAAVPGMGYILHSDYWRQGYGTEAAAAALEHGFGSLGYNRVELWIHEANTASQRLAYTLGFSQRGQFYQRYPHAQAPHETLVFGLRADEWSARQQPDAAKPPRAIPFFNVRPILPVQNVPESMAFYRDRLGFSIDYVGGEPPDFAIMSRGEWSTERVIIHLRRSEVPAAVHVYIMLGPYIDRLHDEYRAAGVTITLPPTWQPWGMREFGIEDNSGHQITFGANA